MIPEINRRLNEWASKLPSPEPPELQKIHLLKLQRRSAHPETNGELEQLMEHTL